MPIADVVTTITEWQKRAPLYAIYRDYYRGNQTIKFASQNWQQNYAGRLKDLHSNVCPAVVSAFTDRLNIKAWNGAGSDGSLALDESLDQGLARLQNMVHREAFRCGDAYVTVWPGRDGTPKPRFRRADEIVPHLDDLDPDMLDWYGNPWLDPTSRYGRVNVVYADRMERYRTRNPLSPDDSKSIDPTAFPADANAWEPYDGDGESDMIHHDFGVVPCCWFVNDQDEPGGYGDSVLADVIPLQDVINKSWADLEVLCENYGLPFWYLLNFKPEAKINPDTGKLEVTVRKFDQNRQRIFTHDGPGPFGQLDPPDLTRLLAKIAATKLEIAGNIGIPSYYFTQTSGDVPSGESLKVLSSRLTSAVSTFQQDSSPVWHGLMGLLGFDAWPEWEPAAPTTEAEQLANAQAKKDLGYSFLDVLRDLGEPDAEGIAERGQAQQAEAAARAGNVLTQGFGL